MACALQLIRPVSNAFMRLGPGSRAAWTCPELATKYDDLITWRDTLYDKHRRPS